jgi:cystathionine gamma-lyase
MKFATKAIHAGQEPDPTTGAIMTPIYQTSTYWQKSPGDNKGYEYSRGTNPTRKALEDCLAALENAQVRTGFFERYGCYRCGNEILAPGDEVITGNDLYGGSYRIFTKIYANYGIKFHFLDLSDPRHCERICER